jgi:MYXO-CTERM domain-containing protein
VKLRQLAIVTALVAFGTLTSSAAWATHDNGNGKSQDWHSGNARVTAFEPVAGALAAVGLGAALLLRRRK